MDDEPSRLPATDPLPRPEPERETLPATNAETETPGEVAGKEREVAGTATGPSAPHASVARAAPLPLGVRCGLAVLSGVLYWLAFPNKDVWPLTFVALVPLILALRGVETLEKPAKTGLLLGLLAGTTMNVCGFLWLVEMLRTFSGFPTVVCLAFVVLVCTYQGGRIALLGWLYARGARFPRAPRALLFALAFAGSELLYPLLFPWFYAATVHDVPALTQTAEIGGPIFVGLVLVAANLAIAEILSSFRERRQASRRTVGAGFGIVGLAVFFGVARIGGVMKQAESAPAAKVGIVQGNMELIRKREDPAEGLRRHVRMTQELERKGDELVVWSESAVTFPQKEEAAAQNLKNMFARSLGVPAIFGAVLYSRGESGEHWYNVAVATDRSGTMTSRYDKEFLLAFGEYLPFGDMFPILYEWSPNSGRFSPGKEVTPLVVFGKDGVKRSIAALICYEDILPSFTNRAVAKTDPELIVNLTNDAWFGDTAEPWEHLALSQFRAIEHRRYFVRSTNSGVSAIVDPVGRVMVHTGTFKSEAIDATIHWMASTTCYELLGDVPLALLAIASLALALWPRKKTAPPPLTA